MLFPGPKTPPTPPRRLRPPGTPVRGLTREERAQLKAALELSSRPFWIGAVPDQTESFFYPDKGVEDSGLSPRQGGPEGFGRESVSSLLQHLEARMAASEASLGFFDFALKQLQAQLTPTAQMADKPRASKPDPGRVQSKAPAAAAKAAPTAGTVSHVQAAAAAPSTASDPTGLVYRGLRPSCNGVGCNFGRPPSDGVDILPLIEVVG